MPEGPSGVLLSLAAAIVVAVASVACEDDAATSPSETPPTPIAFQTPPVPTGDYGITEFSPQCDAKIISVARGEAKLRDAIFVCETPMQWAGAVIRYPSALGPNSDKGEIFMPLVQKCFRTSPAEFAASRLCQAMVGGRTVTP